MDFFNIEPGYIFNKKHILGRDFYSRDTAAVARELLGKILISGSKDDFCGAIIVETEAYYGQNDPASHAYNGITPRSRIMFGNPGTAYVYFCYGNHHLLNLVTEAAGIPGAVLLRAARPIFGIEIMKNRRETSDIYKLARGPGNLTKAFGVNKAFNGKDITDLKTGLFVSDNSFLNQDIINNPAHNKEFKKEIPIIPEAASVTKEIISSRRIGIRQGTEALLRFYLKGSRFVSGKHL